MKKIYSTLVFCFAFTLVYSQLSFGVKSGVNFSKHRYYINDDFTSTVASVTGLEMGAVGLYHFNSKVGIKTEIGFVQKGGAVPNDFSIKINEIELATLAIYKISSDNIYFYIGGGGFAGYSLKATTTDSPTGIKEDVDFESPTFNRFDVGLLAGNGIGLNFVKGSLFLESRYRYSFTFFQRSEIEENFEIAIKNIGVGIHIGYLLKL